MQTREAPLADGSATSELLEQQIRVLRERLAFYEGFDLLIQDNVAHARELFRLAAQERETASGQVEQARREATQREGHLHVELETIAADLGELAAAVEGLSLRVARALGRANEPNPSIRPSRADAEFPMAVVAHGVPSARSALSLQRFVATLPQVTSVTTREFAGGVLRLDARVSDPLHVDQFESWEASHRIEPLTERQDVIEFALGR